MRKYERIEREPTSKFTDNQLAQLLLQLQSDYGTLISQGKHPIEIYQALQYRVNYNLQFFSMGSAFYGFSQEDQYKVYTVLNTFFQACPQYARIEQNHKQNLFVFHFTEVSRDDQLRYGKSCYCSTTDTLFTWLMLDTIMLNSYSQSIVLGSHVHGTGGSSGETWAIFLVILLAVIAVAAAFIALYYLFQDFLDNMERFWHNEGWMQAAISMLATAASGFAVGMLTSCFLTAPLMALGLAAGLSNPLGIVILGITCLTIIGAGLGAFITNQIQDYAIKKANPDALDPQDPHRFTLTKEESANLDMLGLDPLKVKCAMVAIRQQLGKDQLPSFLRRSSEKQELINKVRQLRKGELGSDGIMEVQAGDHLLKFDCRKFVYYQPVAVYTHQQQQYPDPQQFVVGQSQGYSQQGNPPFFFVEGYDGQPFSPQPVNSYPQQQFDQYQPSIQQGDVMEFPSLSSSF